MRQANSPDFSHEQVNPSLLQLAQTGFCSSHFFLRKRQHRHPVLQRDLRGRRWSRESVVDCVRGGITVKHWNPCRKDPNCTTIIMLEEKEEGLQEVKRPETWG